MPTAQIYAETSLKRSMMSRYDKNGMKITPDGGYDMHRMIMARMEYTKWPQITLFFFFCSFRGRANLQARYGNVRGLRTM
jgi:hypothetical protein